MEKGKDEPSSEMLHISAGFKVNGPPPQIRAGRDWGEWSPETGGWGGGGCLTSAGGFNVKVSRGTMNESFSSSGEPAELQL